jgi:hypothetical protein
MLRPIRNETTIPANATARKHGRQRDLLLLERDPGTGNLAVLALAAMHDQVIGQLFDDGKVSLRALDEHQGRSGVTVSHLDRVFRLLEIACNRSLQLVESRRADRVLDAFNSLQRLGNLAGRRGGFLGHRSYFLLVLFVGCGGSKTIELGMRRPHRCGEVGGQFRLPDRPGHQRVDGGLIRPQRLQRIGAEPDQDDDQEGWRELDFPRKTDVLDPAEHGIPSVRRSPHNSAYLRSELVDAGADGRIFQLFAVHRLRFDLLGDRIDELVVLPEGWLLGGEFDALLDVELAVDVLSIDEVLADELLVRAMGQHFAVKLIDHDIEVAITELAGLAGDLRVGLFAPLLLDEGNGLLDHCDSFILVRAIARTGGTSENEHGCHGTNERLY